MKARILTKTELEERNPHQTQASNLGPVRNIKGVKWKADHPFGFTAELINPYPVTDKEWEEWSWEEGRNEKAIDHQEWEQNHPPESRLIYVVNEVVRNSWEPVDDTKGDGLVSDAVTVFKYPPGIYEVKLMFDKEPNPRKYKIKFSDQCDMPKFNKAIALYKREAYKIIEL